MYFILRLIIGGIAGWLTGKVMRGRGYGVFVDLILGILGGWVGGWVGYKLGFVLAGWLGYLITAFIGGIILVAIIRLLKSLF